MDNKSFINQDPNDYDINTIILGTDDKCYIVKTNESNNKEWYKIDDLTKFLDSLSDEFYNTAYHPIVEKMTHSETGLEEKFGGRKPFFVKGEQWPSVNNFHMTFFGQLKDPRKKNNILYRIFIMIDDTDNDFKEDFWINTIELNETNLKNQIIIEKPSYTNLISKQSTHSTLVYTNSTSIPKSNIYEPYKIITYTQKLELQSLQQFLEDFQLPDYQYGNDNTLYNKFYDAYISSNLAPSYGVKIGGTPMSTQSSDYVEHYDFLQITETEYLPYQWGDCGIAHVSDNCKFIWDCC